MDSIRKHVPDEDGRHTKPEACIDHAVDEMYEDVCRFFSVAFGEPDRVIEHEDGSRSYIWTCNREELDDAIEGIEIDPADTLDLRALEDVPTIELRDVEAPDPDDVDEVPDPSIPRQLVEIGKTLGRMARLWLRGERLS